MADSPGVSVRTPHHSPTPDSVGGQSTSSPQASADGLGRGESADLSSGGHSGLMQSIAQAAKPRSEEVLGTR